MARSRPYVILNAAMTLDGKIATASGDSEISSGRDLDRVHRLRSRVDAILVGINTVLVDDPMLTVSRGTWQRKKKSPARVIVDSRARIGLSSRIMRSCDTVLTIVASSEQARNTKLERIRRRGAVTAVLGKKRVDLARLLSFLKERGVRRLLVEGGGEINWSMLSAGLVDEVIVTVAPRIAGGRKAVTLVEGEGFAKIGKGIKLKLQRAKKSGGEAVLFYKVIAAAR
ncbi:MAG: 2,5-diamino-6-(ribosylamino)-4(3H)-pyrimidinone 5'-phosphate reductase [Nitrososphaerales archaeon]